jgi:hypothetical protein
MATTGPVITAISAETLDPPGTADRMIRDLRKFGMAPTGAPGRGKSVGNFTPYHYACLLLAYAGAQPSDAGEAASRLFPFERHFSRLPSGQLPPRSPRVPGTLGQVLETIIAGTSGQPYAPHLLLSLDGAEIRWVGASGEVELIEVYGPPLGVEFTPKTWRLRRQTYLDSHLTALAIVLWRDTARDAPPASNHDQESDQ